MRGWRDTAAVLAVWCLTSAAGAEPPAEGGGPAADPPRPQTWGDAERDQTRASGWTWFGMGYERRNRERTERTADPLTAPDEITGSNGKGRSSK